MRITVVIPTIPGREEEVERARASALDQTLSAEAVCVVHDNMRRGAADTRNALLDFVETEWVAFLDDDDVMYPHHLRACSRHVGFSGADVVYPGYDTIGDDPLGCFGMPFDPDLLRQRNYIPVTTLCRTELVKKAGGFQPHPDENGDPCEDWGLWLAMLDLGATFSHLPQRTWIWTTTGGTRGRGV